MKIIRLVPLLLLLCSISIRAQVNGEAQAKPKTSFEDRLAVKVEYFGELVLHPGLSAGMDYTVAKNRWITVHWDTDLGGYWHRWNHSAVFLKTSMGSRFALGPVFIDLNLGAGYMHSWAAGVLYQRAEGGGVEKAANRGHPHFRPHVSFLTGWDGSRGNHRPWTVYIGPEVYLQSSFNHLFLPHVAVKVGFTYKLKQP